MTCSANKKKATPSVGHDSCVAHMRLFKFILGISWTYLGHILDKTQGAKSFSAFRSPKPYLFTEGQFSC